MNKFFYNQLLPRIGVRATKLVKLRNTLGQILLLAGVATFGLAIFQHSNPSRISIILIMTVLAIIFIAFITLAVKAAKAIRAYLDVDVPLGKVPLPTSIKQLDDWIDNVKRGDTSL